MARAEKTTIKLLMPKATAIWLMDNTILTFRQIAAFTDFTEIEIEAAADGDIWHGIVGRNPIENGELTQEELDRCQADNTTELTQSKRELPPVQGRAKGPRYTPVSKRGDKPDAIAYIIKQDPEISDAQICKLVGTTKPTIAAIRDRTHPNSSSLKPRHPAELGLCSYQEYEISYNKGLKAAGKDPEVVKAEREAQLEKELAESENGGEEKMSSEAFDFSNFLTGGTKSSSGTSE